MDELVVSAESRWRLSQQTLGVCELAGDLRGALLDVWAPSAEVPVRIELYDELVMSIKSFEPEGQRTLRAAPRRRRVSTTAASRPAGPPI